MGNNAAYTHMEASVVAAYNAGLRGDTEESEALREAFPGAFAGEVGRG